MRSPSLLMALSCATALVALSSSLAQLVDAESTYLGCYRDKFGVTERDLGDMLALEETAMTPEFCEALCARHEYKYFGLQYGMECWCGNSYGRHGLAPAVEGATASDPKTSCSKACSGDELKMCGGENLNSVYEIRGPVATPPPPPADGRPLIGLVMIVKDEAHTLPQTLLAIKPWIDVFYILDTGSTDGTQAAIKKVLGPKGEVWEEPFIDYGRSRNRALEIAQTAKNPPVFSLMLSADETVYNGAGLRKFCEEHRDRRGGNEEAYYITMDVGWKFDSARLSRTDKTWRYQGRVHEYLSGPKGGGAPSQRVPSTFIKFKVTDPERRSQREFTILRILQEETTEKPKDTRSSFYLARTYNVVGNHTAALKEFERRVSLGGWKEEVYESLYAIAWQKEALKRPWHEVQQAFLEAHAHSNERAEPLHAIASHWFKATPRQPALAYLFAAQCATLAYPLHTSLWVQADVYAWQCHYILGMTGLEIRKPAEGLRHLLKSTLKRPADPLAKQMFIKYRENLGEPAFDQAECEVDPTHCKANQAKRTGGPMPATNVPATPGLVVSSVGGGGGSSRAAVTTLGSTLPSSLTGSASQLSWVYLLLAALVLSNAALLFALRKGRSSPLTACMPSGLLGPDKQV